MLNKMYNNLFVLQNNRQQSSYYYYFFNDKILKKVPQIKVSCGA